MIQFRCECGRELQGREEDVGRQAKCPVCARLVTIPPAEAAPPPARTPDREDRYDDHRSDRHDDRRSDRYADRRERDDRREVDDRPRRRDRQDDDRRPAAAKTSKGLGTAGIIIAVVCVVGCLGMGGVAALFLPAINKVRQASARMKESNNLKQIGMALHHHHDAMGALPAGGSSRRFDGRPPVSWRVVILPYIEQENVFRMYNMNETWDGPTNSRLRNSMPKVFETPGRQAPPGMTYIQAVVGPGTMFEDPMSRPDRRPIRFVDVPDGTSFTIMLVVARDPVPWSKPEDISYHPNGQLPQLSDHFSGGSNVLMADGSIRFLRKNMSPEMMRRLLTRNDGMVVDLDP